MKDFFDFLMNFLARLPHDVQSALAQMPLALLGALGKTLGENRINPKSPQAWAWSGVENSVAACICVAIIVPLARLMALGDYAMCLMSIAGGYMGFSLLDKAKIELEIWLRRRYGNGDAP